MLVAILPARLESTRLPRKMLADLAGEPLIVRTWKRVVASGVAERVVVATDNDEIAAAVLHAGGEVVRTGQCANGTVRVAEAARTLNLAMDDVIVNVQGDEPLVHAQTLHAIVARLRTPVDGRRGGEIASASAELPNSEADNPARVKVVAAMGQALYFSRSPIPHGGPYQVHIGVYAYTHAALRRIVNYPEHELEMVERLEQLRWLAHGEAIQIVPVATPAPSVDTAADLEVVRQIVAGDAAGR